MCWSGAVKRGVAAAILAATAAWVLQGPCPVDPIAYKFCEDGPRPFEGALQVNSELQRAQLLFPGELVQPEAFVIDREGYIYTGLGDGRLARLSPDLTSCSTVLRLGPPPHQHCGTPDAEDHCGRALGLHLHPSSPDLLYAADSSFGLLSINTRSKEVKILVPRGRVDDNEGVPFINFVNDLVVLGNGSVFFTDSSKKFPRRDVVLEAFEGRGNGQLLHFDPSLNRTQVAQDGLFFPNGLCLSHDGSSLLFAETSRARIMRYHLKGPKSGTSDVFLDNLPGLPDNISPNARGDGYWVPFAVTRSWLTEYMVELPVLRSLVVRLGLARAIAHSLPKHALVLEVDPSGRILRSLHDDGGRVLGSISHVLDLGDRLLLGSYEAPHAAVLTLHRHTQR